MLAVQHINANHIRKKKKPRRFCLQIFKQDLQMISLWYLHCSEHVLKPTAHGIWRGTKQMSYWYNLKLCVDHHFLLLFLLYFFFPNSFIRGILKILYYLLSSYYVSLVLYGDFSLKLLQCARLLGYTIPPCWVLYFCTLDGMIQRTSLELDWKWSPGHKNKKLPS